MKVTVVFRSYDLDGLLALLCGIISVYERVAVFILEEAYEFGADATVMGNHDGNFRVGFWKRSVEDVMSSEKLLETSLGIINQLSCCKTFLGSSDIVHPSGLFEIVKLLDSTYPSAFSNGTAQTFTVHCLLVPSSSSHLQNLSIPCKLHVYDTI